MDGNQKALKDEKTIRRLCTLSRDVLLEDSIKINSFFIISNWLKILPIKT
jgi:hypothetical protein